jgi:hypothetical protein
MAKKIQLDYEDEINYQFLGISSGSKDYSLVFHLNKTLDFKFQKAEDFVFPMKNQSFSFSVYVYLDECNMTNFYLLSNKTQGVNLIKGYKHFDYLLIIDGEMDEDDVSRLAKKLKNVPGIVLSSVASSEAFEQVAELNITFEQYLHRILKS